MNIVVLGDVFGLKGLEKVTKEVKNIKEKYNPDVLIVNGENINNVGRGITLEQYNKLINSGVDYITLGNHSFDTEETNEWISNKKRIIKPANSFYDKNGRGYLIFNYKNKKILLINLIGSFGMGRNVMKNFDSPYDVGLEILDSNIYDVAIIDFHSDATAEKAVASKIFRGKKVSLLYGTHTHVQTADERIIEGKMAFITDIGMCGVEDSSIGVNFDEVIWNQHCQPNRKRQWIEPKNSNANINGIIVELEENSLLPLSIKRLKII